MQAYASAEMAPAAEFRLMDRRPTISAGTGSPAASHTLVLDDFLGQLADLVAEKLAARLATPQPDTAVVDESEHTASGLNDRSHGARDAVRVGEVELEDLELDA